MEQGHSVHSDAWEKLAIAWSGLSELSRQLHSNRIERLVRLGLQLHTDWDTGPNSTADQNDVHDTSVRTSCPASPEQHAGGLFDPQHGVVAAQVPH
jgi:hypothetical protein